MNTLLDNYSIATNNIFVSYSFILYLIFIVLIILSTTDKPETSLDIQLLEKYDARFDKMEGEIHQLRELSTMVDSKLDIIIDKLND